MVNLFFEEKTQYKEATILTLQNFERFLGLVVNLGYNKNIFEEVHLETN